jgi:hypothetical protein
MNLIKNIFLVSYLKNKGIRRICFVIGFSLSLFIFVLGWCPQLKDNFFIEEYENFHEFKKENRYNTPRKLAFFKKYPANLGVKNLDNYEDWEEFMFFDGYVYGFNAREYVRDVCLAHFFADKKTLKNKLLETYKEEDLSEAINKVENSCPKIQDYFSQKISIRRFNLLYILWLIPILLFIYPPFIICCIIKWIYKGFKGE